MQTVGPPDAYYHFFQGGVLPCLQPGEKRSMILGVKVLLRLRRV